MHPDLEEAVAFHEAILAEGARALVGYDTPKQLANVVLLSAAPASAAPMYPILRSLPLQLSMV